MKGISFQSLSLVRSIILVCYANDTSDLIITDHDSIPERHSPFVLPFKHDVTDRLVQIQYFDIPGFTETKICVCL